MVPPARHPAAALLVAAALFATPVFAEDRAFATAAGTVILDVDSPWRGVRPNVDGVSGIAFETGGGGRSMNFMLITADEIAGETFSAADVRQLAEQMRENETTDGKTATDIQDLRGARVSGVYFQATGKPGVTPGPGEYRWMIAGAIVTRGTPLIFTIAWNEDGKAAADRAFAAVRGLRLADR